MSEKTSLTLGSLFDGSAGFPLGNILSGIVRVEREQAVGADSAL